jgi:ABC-2 type transport system ATP-binding protein
VPVDQSNQDFIIVVDKLTKRYGEVIAVDNISFKVKRGEIFGFLGPNGAGKTTTVRMLTGVIEPDEGSALISGHRGGSLQAKQVAGVVPEMANAYTDLSGWNNMMFMAELYGISSREAQLRSESLLQALGLQQRRKDPVKAYSKGMRQRLILCMALVSDPEVLFLDEPTSGLDVQSARMMKNMLRDLNSSGKTVFLTTHDMDEANELCDRVAIINQGRIAAIERPEKLKMAASVMHSVEVSFADAVSQEALGKLLGVKRVDKVGDKYRLYTDAPGDLIIALSNYSSSAGLKIVSLNTLYPSLEDAFVALTEKEAEHA